jgi:hypothetical protein
MKREKAFSCYRYVQPDILAEIGEKSVSPITFKAGLR